MMFLIYTSFKLRSIKDGYLIKTELKVATGLGAIIAIVYALPSHLTVTAGGGVQLFMIVVGNLLVFNTSTWKVCHALRFAREQRATDAAAAADKLKQSNSRPDVDATPDLSTVLDNRATRLKFRGS